MDFPLSVRMRFVPAPLALASLPDICTYFRFRLSQWYCRRCCVMPSASSAPTSKNVRRRGHRRSMGVLHWRRLPLVTSQCLGVRQLKRQSKHRATHRYRGMSRSVCPLKASTHHCRGMSRSVCPPQASTHHCKGMSRCACLLQAADSCGMPTLAGPCTGLGHACCCTDTHTYAPHKHTSHTRVHYIRMHANLTHTHPRMRAHAHMGEPARSRGVTAAAGTLSK